MPYFPKEDTETIRLAKVIYATDENGDIIKDHGRPKVLSRIETGETLIIVRKDAPVDVRRGFYSQFTAAQSRERRIASLNKKLDDPELSKERFATIQDEIADLNAQPSAFDLMCKFVADSLRSWDYYATKADCEAGNPIALNADAIRTQCDPDILSQIIDHLNAKTEEESAEGKESPAVSLNGSSQMEASESVQTSTAIMQ